MDHFKIPAIQNLLRSFSLRDAVKIIGWAFLTGHIVGILETPFSNLWLYLHCDSIEFYTDPDTQKCPDWITRHLLFTVVADFGLSIAEIGTSFLLLLGVYQKIPRYIKQWIILETILLVMDLLLTKAGILREFIFTARITSIIYYICKCVEVFGIFICYRYYKTVETSVTVPSQDA